MQLSDIQSCLRAGIVDRATKLGPFLVLINERSANPFRNYAVPRPDAEPTEADIADLVWFFKNKDRQPRLEYVRPNPKVDRPLRAAGFTIDGTLGLMALDHPDTFVAPRMPADIDVIEATTDDQLRQAVTAQNAAYGEPADREPEIGGLRRTLDAGGGVALALHTPTGQPVGAGLYDDPQDGLTEIASIGVVPEFRNRGVGSAVAGLLTEAALSLGLQPFLQVEKDEPARIYERLGYRRLGELADARLTRE